MPEKTEKSEKSEKPEKPEKPERQVEFKLPEQTTTTTTTTTKSNFPVFVAKLTYNYLIFYYHSIFY